MRATALVAGALLAGAIVLIVVGATAAPLSRTCGSAMTEAACEGAVSAVLRRGLPPLHPLPLAAHVEPGADPGPGELGHRATVAFDLLGVPGTTEVRLFTDQGGHWGGVPSRSDVELAAWALAPLVVAGAVAAGIGGLAAYGRRRTLTASRASKTR